MDITAQLTRGCAWAYRAMLSGVMLSGVMPEHFELIECEMGELAITHRCQWLDIRWRIEGNQSLPRGFWRVIDKGYSLRPEAIESVFYMWRTTGDEVWRDMAWEMFVAIRKLTQTEDGAHCAVDDVTEIGPPKQCNRMETFWLGETLKYFHLIFTEPILISLDDYFLNTEAHPFHVTKH